MFDNSLNLLIKPASSDCNMRCKYCFYRDEARQRKKSSYGVMNSETAENILKKSLAVSESCNFCFQGGEPTLAGLDFFREFTGCVKKHKKKSQKISYSLQTNGTRINNEWLKFLAAEKFLVGVSIDGPPSEHDRFRLDPESKPSFYRIFSNSRKMLSAGIDVNVLTVLTDENALTAGNIYNFFKKTVFYIIIIYLVSIRSIGAVFSSAAKITRLH